MICSTVSAAAEVEALGRAYVRGTLYDVRFEKFGGYAANLASVWSHFGLLVQELAFFLAVYSRVGTYRNS